MSYAPSSPRSAKLVSLQQVKQLLRITNTLQDQSLLGFIDAVTDIAEEETNNVFACTEYTRIIDRFGTAFGFPVNGHYGSLYTPTNQIIIAKGRLRKIVDNSIIWIDYNGVKNYLNTDTLVIDNNSMPARITPMFGQIFPANVIPQINSVIIKYVAGYFAPFSVGTEDELGRVVPSSLWEVLKPGDGITFWAREGDVAGSARLPTPLLENVKYYVVDVRSTTEISYGISTTPNGSSITVANDGFGDLFIGERPSSVISWASLHIGSLYANREAISGQATTILPSNFLRSLLSRYTITDFVGES